ncbi:hypothetical protein ACFQLX_01470 [Streptomyces polyrhachis]|uniref:Secreted protein n=1 Tax=Streptomyces polyrhachis TaxID=1282885 RepID=A0ABW2G7V0_9ACTN
MMKNPTRRPVRRAVVAVCAAAVVAAGVVVGVQSFGGDDGSSGTGGTVSAAEFYAPLAFGGSMREVEHYDSLADAADAADAVVIAEVAGVKETRLIEGDGSDRLSMLGVVIRPVEVLRGSLPASDEEELTVEFIGGSADLDQTVAEMKAALPEGRSVWFLRAKAEEGKRHLDELKQAGTTPSDQELAAIEGDKPYYRVVSSQGLFVEEGANVVNPVAAEDAEADPMITEGEKYTELSELVAHVRE